MFYLLKTFEDNISIPLAALVGAPLCEKFKSLAKNKFSCNQTTSKTSKIKSKNIYPTSNSGYGIGKKINFVMKALH